MKITLELTERELQIILVSVGEMSVLHFNTSCEAYRILGVQPIDRQDDVLFDTFKKIKAKAIDSLVQIPLNLE